MYLCVGLCVYVRVCMCSCVPVPLYVFAHGNVTAYLCVWICLSPSVPVCLSDCVCVAVFLSIPVCLSALCMSADQPVRLSVCLPAAWTSGPMSVCPYVSASVPLSVYLCLSVCMSVCLSDCPAFDPYLYLSLYLPIHPSVHQSDRPSVRVSVCLAVDPIIFITTIITSSRNRNYLYLIVKPFIICYFLCLCLLSTSAKYFI